MESSQAKPLTLTSVWIWVENIKGFQNQKTYLNTHWRRIEIVFIFIIIRGTNYLIRYIVEI